MKKKRLDEILVGRGLVKDKNEAFVRVTAGLIFIGGQRAVSPAQMFNLDVPIRIKTVSPYVGRGGLKLKAAFDAFRLDISGKVCADIGAATGGFADVMLQHGAKRVYAIDVGTGKLALKLRENPRVVVMEKTNILYLESLPEPIEFLAADLSFTSLRLLLSVINKFLTPGAGVVTLFKPQYEAPETDIKHGIVRDDAVRKRELDSFLSWSRGEGWEVRGVMESPIRGAKGNVEYLIHLKS